MVNLNQKQIEKLSDIASDIGLVMLASVVIQGIFTNFAVVILNEVKDL